MPCWRWGWAAAGWGLGLGVVGWGPRLLKRVVQRCWALQIAMRACWRPLGACQRPWVQAPAAPGNRQPPAAAAGVAPTGRLATCPLQVPLPDPLRFHRPASICVSCGHCQK